MLQNKINSLPQENGIYIFKNEFDDIIYIGKAKNLKKRVSQYFQNKNLGVKTEHLVKKIKDLDFIIVNNELEALLLENKLIKKHNPKYNIKLKDDKTYAYLKLTDEKFPKLVMTRRVLSKKKNFLGEIYFGPYADNFQRKILFNLCSELFQILTNKTFTNKTKLNYDIGLAPSKSKKELDENFYKKKVELTINFLKGKNIKEILKNLYSQMKKESEKLNFEFAKKIKDKIIAIERLQEQNSQLVDLQKNNSQDVIVFKEKNNVIKFLILKIKQGTILKKEIYEI